MSNFGFRVVFSNQPTMPSCSSEFVTRWTGDFAALVISTRETVSVWEFRNVFTLRTTTTTTCGNKFSCERSGPAPQAAALLNSCIYWHARKFRWALSRFVWGRARGKSAPALDPPTCKRVTMSGALEEDANLDKIWKILTSALWLQVCRIESHKSERERPA